MMTGRKGLGKGLAYTLVLLSLGTDSLGETSTSLFTKAVMKKKNHLRTP